MVLRYSRPAKRRFAVLTAGVLALGAVMSGPGAASDAVRVPPPPRPLAAAEAAPEPSASAPGGAAAPPSRSGSVSTAFGAYLNYGADGVDRMKDLSNWLGGAELRVGHTYLPGDLWSNIEGPPGFLDAWAKWRRDKKDRLFVLNVPMMDQYNARLSNAMVRRLMARAAAGEFDRHFQTLAKRLVDLGVPDTIIVLGWEMNGITYTHRCNADPERWKVYWRRIVKAMRSVPGQQFKFDFAPSRGMDAIPWPECYPGDDVVDIIGMDSYDIPQGQSFDEEVSEPYGLRHQVDFAARHGKEISYPEWGLFRNGDNVKYMLRMLAWIDEHKPLYQTITDYCPHGVWACSANPRAAALYRLVMTDPQGVPKDRSPTPAPSPAAGPARPPSASVPPCRTRACPG